MATSKMDKWANIAAVPITESAADTLTVAKFSFPFSIMDKMALILNRIEYFFSSPGVLNSTLDYTCLALLAGGVVSDITFQNDPLVIDSVTLQRVDLGAAASGNLVTRPFVKELSTLPGGGLLVAPAPLYAGIKGNGESGAASGWVKLFYTYIELSPDEYWQLVESRRIISI